jgi:hypothetical protein
MRHDKDDIRHAYIAFHTNKSATSGELIVACTMRSRSEVSDSRHTRLHRQRANSDIQDETNRCRGSSGNNPNSSEQIHWQCPRTSAQNRPNKGNSGHDERDCLKNSGRKNLWPATNARVLHRMQSSETKWANVRTLRTLRSGNQKCLMQHLHVVPRLFCSYARLFTLFKGTQREKL